jgi:hypothetical protein
MVTIPVIKLETDLSDSSIHFLLCILYWLFGKFCNIYSLTLISKFKLYLHILVSVPSK